MTKNVKKVKYRIQYIYKIIIFHCYGIFIFHGFRLRFCWFDFSYVMLKKSLNYKYVVVYFLNLYFRFRSIFIINFKSISFSWVLKHRFTIDFGIQYHDFIIKCKILHKKMLYSPDALIDSFWYGLRYNWIYFWGKVCIVCYPIYMLFRKINSLESCKN